MASRRADPDLGSDERAVGTVASVATSGPDPSDAANWTIVTPTYGRDLEQFTLLNESVVRMAPAEIEHLVVVDADDLHLFEPFRHDRMRLVTKEAVLPGRVRRVGRSKQLWLSTRLPPVRGWIAQQIVKIEAAAHLSRPFVLFADSDVVFLRHFDVDRFCRDDRIALSSVDYANEEGRLWRRSSAALLGVDSSQHHSAQTFVASLIPWRRDVAAAMVERIESRRRLSWTTQVALRRHFSEYTLYGTYCAAMGLPESGHFPWSESILNLMWNVDLDRDGVHRAIRSTTPGQIGAMLHSKSDFDPADLRDAVEDFWQRPEPD